MRVTILGGGGFRVPLLHRSLAADGSGVTAIVLHDTDPARLGAVLAVLRERGGGGPELVVEHDLAAAVRGADFVFSAIRVGGLRGRACDERVALAEGLLGQETVGAGGVLYGLRTAPVAIGVAETIRRHAPGAWVINFTNPAGMITEVMRAVLGERVIGICDSPVGLFRRVARALAVDESRAWFDYAGLNHLGWLRQVVVDGRDVLPRLLADDEALDSFEEGRLFGAARLRALGAIPNEYLFYYYFTGAATDAAAQAAATRGEFLLAQQESFYAAAERPGAAARWERARREREASYLAEGREAAGAGERDAADLDGGGYDQVALALMRAIAKDEGTRLVLNVANGATLPGLDADAVVEVPCLVDGAGARPLPVSPLAPDAAALVTAVKAVERATIEAARSGSRRAAVKALAAHPLVDSGRAAQRMLERELAALPELRSVLVAD